MSWSYKDHTIWLNQDEQNVDVRVYTSWSYDLLNQYSHNCSHLSDHDLMCWTWEMSNSDFEYWS